MVKRSDVSPASPATTSTVGLTTGAGSSLGALFSHAANTNGNAKSSEKRWLILIVIIVLLLFCSNFSGVCFYKFNKIKLIYKLNMQNHSIVMEYTPTYTLKAKWCTPATQHINPRTQRTRN
jgi:hypothetical protein